MLFICSLLSEYHELYELQRKRLETQVTNLAVERELWSAAAYNLALKVRNHNWLLQLNYIHPVKDLRLLK